MNQGTLRTAAALPARRMVEPFSVPGFRPLWFGAVFFSAAQWMDRVVIGWFILESTDSAFLTSAAVSVQMGPGLFVGFISGAISDRSPRPKVLSLTAGVRTAVAAVLALLVGLGAASLPMVFALLALAGAAQSMQLSSLQTLSGDLVGHARRAQGISLVSTGQRGVSALGALGGGLLMSLLGPTVALVTAAALCLIASVLFRSIEEPRRRTGVLSTSLLADTVEGLVTVARVPLVSILLGLMVVVEIFGYPFFALLPAIADRVVHVGPTGLGGLNAAAAVGAVLGLTVLSAYSDRMRLGLVFLAIFALFGVMMITIGSAPWYVVALLAAAAIGCCTGMIDTIEWILLQQAVEDRLRGRVLGAWNVAIGFGWIVGPLTLGALVDATSVGLAFALAGSLLIVTSALALMLSARIRTA